MEWKRPESWTDEDNAKFNSFIEKCFEKPFSCAVEIRERLEKCGNDLESWNGENVSEYAMFLNGIFSSLKLIPRDSWEKAVKPKEWTTEDENKYREKIGLFVNHFKGQFKSDSRKKLNEGITDLTGLKIAYKALRNKCGGGEDTERDKRFFSEYAELWVAHRSQDYDDLCREHDTHGSPEERVNGVLPHINEWYKAFDVKEGKLFLGPKERCHLFGKN